MAPRRMWNQAFYSQGHCTKWCEYKKWYDFVKMKEKALRQKEPTLNIEHSPKTFILIFLWHSCFNGFLLKCSNSDGIKIIQKNSFKSFERQTADSIILMPPFVLFCFLTCGSQRSQRYFLPEHVVTCWILDTEPPIREEHPGHSIPHLITYMRRKITVTWSTGGTFLRFYSNTCKNV